MRISIIITSILLFCSKAYGQDIINAYAQVNGVSGVTLTLSNVDETHDTFEAGENIIIMQMQDDIIGGNTANDANFGNIADIRSAGLFEVLEIASVTESASIPTSIEVVSVLENTYNTGTNASIQIISFPRYANFVTTADLTALAWDGNVGGVFAIDVTNNLTLQHNINVDYLGFRGGLPNATADGSGCSSTVYITNSDRHAKKGESAYKLTDVNFEAGRAKSANGGGGGSFHNAGGGGGGNFTAGGEGGPGWDGSAAGCTPSAGGIGGADLSDHISASRVYLGGGGGGGQQNDYVAFAGGNGGGIILVRANTVTTTGGCGTLGISASGESTPLSGNDGGGGGGAGGSLIFEVTNWNLACEITVSAAGGDGGSVNSGAAHGGGGGGGRGVIVMSGAAPAVNFTTNNNSGAGGTNSNNGTGGDASTGETFPSSPDAEPDGYIVNTSGALPVSLLDWTAKIVNGGVSLEWSTATEINNDYFTVYRSTDGNQWEAIKQINGQGNTTAQQEYSMLDTYAYNGVIFYRLTQTDYDGTTEIFETIPVNSHLDKAEIIAYPNPNNGFFTVQVPFELNQTETSTEIFDTQGRKVNFLLEEMGNQMKFDLSNQPNGVYFLRVKIGNTITNSRIVIR